MCFDCSRTPAPRNEAYPKCYILLMACLFVLYPITVTLRRAITYSYKPENCVYDKVRTCPNVWDLLYKLEGAGNIP